MKQDVEVDRTHCYTRWQLTIEDGSMSSTTRRGLYPPKSFKRELFWHIHLQKQVKLRGRKSCFKYIQMTTAEASALPHTLVTMSQKPGTPSRPFNTAFPLTNLPVCLGSVSNTVIALKTLGAFQGLCGCGFYSDKETIEQKQLKKIILQFIVIL